MAKYNEEKGFIKGISDEEFEVLLRLSFALNEFQIDKIKRSVLVANDFVLGLFRVEKRFLKGERIYNYVAYIDRKHHEYSDKWMSDFWARVNSNDFPLYSRLDKEIERILILSIDKIKKKEIKKDLRENIKFYDGDRFFGFLFSHPPESISLLSALYHDESKKWDAMGEDKQKDFCENIGVDHIKFQRLWKYPIGRQSKVIIGLQDSGNGAKERREKRESEERERQERREQEEREREQRAREGQSKSDSSLKKYYDCLRVSESATPSEVKAAYRKEVKFYHPDNFQNRTSEIQKDADKKTQEVREAYERLKDAGRAD